MAVSTSPHRATRWPLLLGVSIAIAALPLGMVKARAGPAPQPGGTTDEYFRGRVVVIERTRVQEVAGEEHYTQIVRVRVGGRQGEIRAEHSVPLAFARDQAVSPGDAVVVVRTQGPGGPTFYVADRYRLLPLGMIFALFVLAVVWFSRIRGLTAIIGLGVSILVLARFVVPRILSGGNPLAVSLTGALMIAATSVYLAHGFSRRTSVALVGTLGTLGIAAGLAILFVGLAGLTGAGTEEAFDYRSLVGNIALVLAVPITTWLAAHVLRASGPGDAPPGGHAHVHGRS